MTDRIPPFLPRFIPFMLLVFLCYCNSRTGESDGVKTIYFEGTQKIRQTITYKDGLRNGEMKEFFPNGNLKAKQFYRNDTVIDTLFFYHSNGQLAEYQIVKDRKKFGCWRKYNKSGRMYSEINFKDGVFDGTSSVYSYNNGKLLERYNFEKGSKHGKQETFYNNGRQKYVAYFYHDQACLGTEEWSERGEKINNDFKISVTEQNQLLMSNTLRYLVKLENPRADDDVYEASLSDTGRVVNTTYHLEKEKDHFKREYTIYKGGFMMQKIKFAAYRKTPMGNTIVKTVVVTASANNF